MNLPERVGVVGAAGSLGGQLSSRIANQYPVTCYDVARPENSRSGRKMWVSSVRKLVERSDLIHWCAPTTSVAEIPTLNENQMLVLHDSVMARSCEAAERLREDPAFLGRIAIVHCLMNETKTVVVERTSNQQRRIKRHLYDIGLRPKSLSTDEHDTIMAESQAPFALLHELLMPNLSMYSRRGLLTPSGEALREALEDRSARWTPETLKSILSNPNLTQLIADMDVLIDSILRSESP